MSPLAEGVLNIDLAKQFDAKLVIVAANRLGVIHQSLATCTAAVHLGIQPSGLLLSSLQAEGDESVSSNAKQIQQYCEVQFLGNVPYQGNRDDLEDESIRRIESLLG